jgi:myosin heavy subunit
METLSNELKDLGSSSSNAITRAVYGCADVALQSPQASNGNRRSSVRGGVSVGSQFKASLQSLLGDLEATQPHYIRCIKPNSRKAPNSFASGDILKQLRYSGMMEANRIRSEGYALREDHKSFYKRFSLLMNPDELKEGDSIEQLVRVMSKRLNVTDADWQIGHSRIFLRRGLSEKLERLAKLRVHAAARTIGKFGRDLAHKRKAALLVHWASFRLHMLKFYTKARAATRISSLYRKYSQVKIYAKDLSSIVKVQSLQRRRKAIYEANVLRDPFFGMTPKDLKTLLKSTQDALDKAVGANNFEKAAELEAKM